MSAPARETTDLGWRDLRGTFAAFALLGPPAGGLFYALLMNAALAIEQPLDSAYWTLAALSLYGSPLVGYILGLAPAALTGALYCMVLLRFPALALVSRRRRGGVAACAAAATCCSWYLVLRGAAEVEQLVFFISAGALVAFGLGHYWPFPLLHANRSASA